MVGHSTIHTVGFSLGGDEDHRRASQAEITSYEIQDTSGVPVRGGVGDLRMGTTDHNLNCLACACGKKTCNGHRGHIVLRAGIPQPIAIAEIRRWLRVACLKCGAIIVERDKYEHLPPAARLIAAASAANEGRRCPRRECGAIHPKIVKDEEDNFSYLIKHPSADTSRSRKKAAAGEDKGERLPADAISAAFARISDADCLALGRSLDVHPRKLILHVVPVAPNTIRPSVKNYGGAGNSYNDSTNLIQNLVKRNQQLPKQLPDHLTSVPDLNKPRAAPPPKDEAAGAKGPRDKTEEEKIDAVDRAVLNMQQIYYDLVMGSSSTNATQGNSGRRGLVIGSRAVRSYLRNLPRKDGRIRANLLGKRVFYISRSTISGNMSFRVDEVGVPLEFARTLQVEETVQEYNRDWLMPFFLNGRRQYPGCTQVRRRATGELHDVTGRSDFQLEVGDVLFRDVIDGDVAYFNRQPSLERSNIGVHKVIVIQDPSVRTLQMNVLACEGYNADFDGDCSQNWSQSHSRVARHREATRPSKCLWRKLRPGKPKPARWLRMASHRAGAPLCKQKGARAAPPRQGWRLRRVRWGAQGSPSRVAGGETSENGQRLNAQDRRYNGDGLRHARDHPWKSLQTGSLVGGESRLMYSRVGYARSVKSQGSLKPRKGPETRKGAGKAGRAVAGTRI